MTLALFLLCSLSWTAPVPSLAVAQDQPAAQATSGSQTDSDKKPQEGSSESQGIQSETKPQSGAQAAKQPAAKKKRHHKKKAAAANCTPAPAAVAGSEPGSSVAGSANAASGTSAQNSGAAASPTNCPPKINVVRHGGTSEPSIQLAGGPPNDQLVQQRNVVNQMLGTTEANLKKIAGHQLSASQQDTVAQTRQFITQSKEAVASGDLDRARTLAWKAEMLSQDLVNPK